ncbi:hypothetical protein K437DRAFT_84988 [Tilletiaria anomala UBC 951]|uniref:Uncharacterized protein n=1 Tax=Tilletiaria anomala (strain ATCC 24038 / CBS 436.72 / UBC 951) TaxID=1037660 RepID=A0A066W7N0_TILAU|nr:uncharacterized protein K437DRAFT_84988 [Tilletiaria anomala UBC 951]KDN48548.1 hypothetical protein K437DRAFT_84988 [Tilletiaria anomala UBC 951]
MATVEAATAAVFMSPSASPTAPGPGGGSSAESLIQHARQRNETAPAQADEEQEEDDHSLVPIGAAYLGATRASLRSASRSPGYNYHHHRSTGRSIAAQQQQEEEDLATADLRTVFDPATCAKRGRVAVPARVVPWHPVASKRKQNQNQKYNKAQRIMRSNGNGTENTTAAEEEAEHEGAEETFRIYYEVHGHGPKRMVFVMGLNMACFG